MKNPTMHRRLGTTVLAAALACGGVLTLATPAAADPAGPRSYTSTDNGDGTYSVPLVNADVPDNSVIRVPAAENDEGRDIYYMVSTTMHLAPGAPIMKSYDLVNWETVNYVYDRLNITDAPSLRNGLSSYGEGQWASSIAYHNGTYYVGFNTNNLNGSYIYRTTDIENGSWTKTALGRGFHDLSLFFDDANGGTPYIFYGAGSTSAVQLNSDLTAVVAEYPNIFAKADYAGANYLASSYEGTQVYRIGDYYYMVTISWPSGGSRQVVMFRSKDLLGRYTAAGGVNNYEIKAALNSDGFAQGSLVPIARTDGQTDWYGYFFRDTYPVGRIPGLIPATWQDGWPTFGNNGVVNRGSTFAKPITLSPAETERERLKSVVASDDFDNDAPHKAYADAQWTIPAAPSYDQSLLGVELLQNGNFETGQLAPWAMQYTANLVVQDNADVGSKVLSVSGRVNNGSGPGQDLTGKIQPGVTYKVSFKVRYDEGTATKNFIPAFSWGGSIKNMASVSVPKGQWTTVTGTYTVPSDATWSSIKFVVETPWASNQTAADQVSYLIDDISLVGQPVTKEYPAAGEAAYNGSDLDLAWEWNHAPDNRYWSLTERPGWLSLTNGHLVSGTATYQKGSRDDLTYFETARNTLSQRTFGPKTSAQTRLDIAGMKDGDTAGLAIYTRSFTYAAVRNVDGVPTLGVVYRPQPFSARIDRTAVEQFVPGTTVALNGATTVSLKADTDLNVSNGQLFVQFMYSLDGRTWQNLGPRQGALSYDWSLSHFMGYRVGLFNYATKQTGGRVDFDYYDLSDTFTADNQAISTAELDAAITKAQGLPQAGYPDADWAELQSVLGKAMAARQAGFSTHNEVDAPTLALYRALADYDVFAEQHPAPALDVTAVAGSRCVAGKAMPTITVTNDEDVPVAVTVASGGTTKSFASVAPGKNAFHAFTTRQASVPAGTVSVQASATVDGENVTVTEDVPYDGINCG